MKTPTVTESQQWTPCVQQIAVATDLVEAMACEQTIRSIVSKYPTCILQADQWMNECVRKIWQEAGMSEAYPHQVVLDPKQTWLMADDDLVALMPRMYPTNTRRDILSFTLA